MGTATFSDAFKRDAVAQITERGYPAKEVSERLGVSTHSLYAWKRKFAKAATGETDKDVEIRRLKRELALDFVMHGDGLALSKRRITLSTSGAVVLTSSGRICSRSSST